MPTKAQYQQIIERAFQREKDRLPQELEKGLHQTWDATPLFGYSPPGWMLDFGGLCAFLFARSGESQFAEQARNALLYYREWLLHLPPGAASQRPEYVDGVPPMEPVFSPVVFVPAVQNIRSMLSDVELEALVSILADSLRPIWRFPEWGGHNRAMLRAAGLALSAAAFPTHPDAARWTSLADELAEESWGRWSIEDTMMYQAHWLRALFLYAEARHRQPKLREMIQPRLHLQAAVQLISPLGILPDFGDSHWLMHSHWEWMACLEWGARAYQNPAMKWAANRIYTGSQVETPDAHIATAASLAWKWCDESVMEDTPVNREDALDDLVVKKIVWRTGWAPEATYACLNYRDEGDYGRVARDYLRGTLAVTAEKMHHGHADEGSFVMMTHDQTLLLHESGYRESPPDGIYRSAVYHNRLTWRNGRVSEAQGLLEFLRGDGHYHPVSTERLYQTRLGDIEFNRVRTTDENEGIAWDRSVIFLPGLPCWIVLDSVMAICTGLRTVSSLWWTTDLLAQGENWFETHVRAIQDWQNRKEAALLIYMPPIPHQPSQLSVEPFRRSFQDEVALARTWVGEHRAEHFINFVTVLWPHRYADLDENRPRSIQVIESRPRGRGIGIWLRWQDEEHLFGVLNDLAIGVGKGDIRPTYSAELGATRYGPLFSDAALVALHRNAPIRQNQPVVWAGFINGTFFSYNDRKLYEGLQHAMFQENRTALPGVPARFRWESTFNP